MSISLVLAILLGSLSANLMAGPGESAGIRPEARELSFLVRCAFSAEDPRWMWDVSDENFMAGEKQFGLFLGGAQHIRYSPLMDCLSRFASIHGPGDTQDFYHGLAEFSGLPVYQAKQGSQSFRNDINYYNPELIVWMREKAIPDPGTPVLPGLNFQDLYNIAFQRNARILAFSYKELNDSNRYRELVEEYRTSDDRTRVDMKYTLLSDSKLQDSYASEANDEYGFNFDPGHAATFWLRRGLDETHLEVFELLKTVFAKYDPDALKKLNQK